MSLFSRRRRHMRLKDLVNECDCVRVLRGLGLGNMMPFGPLGSWRCGVPKGWNERQKERKEGEEMERKRSTRALRKKKHPLAA